MSILTDALKHRRSIRKYKPEPIPTELIKDLLEIASYSPSAHNAPPRRFIVLTDNLKKNVLANAMAEVWLVELQRDHIPKNTQWATVNASVERFTSAPILVLACLTLEDMDTYPDSERQNNERDLAVQSLAAATQTLLLAAYDNGLGACWYCAPIFCKTAVRKALKIPDDAEAQALITLEYPAEVPKTPQRYPTEKFSYLNEWGNPL